MSPTQRTRQDSLWPVSRRVVHTRWTPRSSPNGRQLPARSVSGAPDRGSSSPGLSSSPACRSRADGTCSQTAAPPFRAVVDRRGRRDQRRPGNCRSVGSGHGTLVCVDAAAGGGLRAKWRRRCRLRSAATRKGVDRSHLDLPEEPAPARVGLFGSWPRGSPVTGSTHKPSIRYRCSSVTTDPFSTPSPSARPASPAPRKMPGGVPDSA